MLNTQLTRIQVDGRLLALLTALMLAIVVYIPPLPLGFDDVDMHDVPFNAEFWPRFTPESRAGEAWTRDPGDVARELFAMGSDFRREHAVVTQWRVSPDRWVVLVEERARDSLFCLEMYRVEIARAAEGLVPVRVQVRGDCNPVKWTLLYARGQLPSRADGLASTNFGY